MREDMISLLDDKRDKRQERFTESCGKTGVKEGEIYQVNKTSDTRSCYCKFISVNHEICDDSRGIKEHTPVLEWILVRNLYPGL